MRSAALSPVDRRVDPLFANHLAFLDSHRGQVAVSGHAVAVEGLKPDLSSWTPLMDAAELPSNEAPVRLIPSSGKSWPSRLPGFGYRPAETLVYMALEGRPEEAPSLVPGMEIRAVARDEEAVAFAGVQAAGFLDEGDSEFGWWAGCFRRMALTNYGRDDQSFFLASMNGMPASVLLCVRAADVTGLYAVATDPAFRDRGLSTALLRHAHADALDHGHSTLVLQAHAGSYAEGFYRRLGFVERYRSQMWRRP